MKERKLEIILDPHTYDNAETPYFWSVLEYNENTSEWVNIKSGWSKTPLDAFNDGWSSHMGDFI